MISEEAAKRLEARGLDTEIAVRMGWASTQRDGRDLVVIPFTRGERTLRRKVRNIDGEKYFSQIAAGGEQSAWNEDVLRDESLIGQPLIITEGEFDALTAIQCGFERTISVPNGAPPAKAENGQLRMDGRYEWLLALLPLLTRERCPEIILAADNDEPGAQLLHDLSNLLERFRCKFLSYPKLPYPDGARDRCKDLNEVIQLYGAKGVVETIARAQWIKVDGVYQMGDLPPAPAPLKFDIDFSVLGENYTMRLGDLVVVTGVPGLGKTTFVNDLCCRVAWRHKLRIAWASFEQMPQRDHRRNLRSWHAEKLMKHMSPEEIAAADAWIGERHRFIVPADDEDVTLDWLLDRMEIAAVQHGVNVIVIDPWNEMDHVRERDETMTEYVGRAIKTFRRFARRMQVHVIVVAHPAKLQKVEGRYKPPTLYDISDSANWYNKCDLGLIVHRESEDYTDIKVQKSRYHEEIGKPGEVRMAFCAEDRRFRELERLA